ncbi:hypothetical protein SO802_000773 [Lithocarpus litseifolius]|uniref:DUF4283 domain-containing protein n=1 Tax=Lithocarpus litseifolius TaxID=425828 RepID=A0AAW2DW90_9ROSI
MDASLEELWKKFTLSEEEKVVLSVNAQDVAQSKEQAQFSLLFKLQTNREFNKEAFKSTIQQLWRGSQRVSIKEVGNNLFLAIFDTKEHMNDILDRSPWSFDKRLVMLKCFTNDVSSENVTFQRSPFWIRVFNIPIKRGAEDDFDLESGEERGDRHLTPTLCQQQMSPLISKPSNEIVVAISLDNSANITGCQVTPQSQNLNLNSNDRLKSHPPNPEKPTSLSSSNSYRIEKPK